jgi:hypothetical protein
MFVCFCMQHCRLTGRLKLIYKGNVYLFVMCLCAFACNIVGLTGGLKLIHKGYLYLFVMCLCAFACNIVGLMGELKLIQQDNLYLFFYYVFVCVCMQHCRVNGWVKANSQRKLYLFVMCVCAFACNIVGLMGELNLIYKL